MHVPSLCRIDEMVPTTNFISELGNLAEFMYSVGKCVISKRQNSKLEMTDKSPDAASSEEDEGLGECRTPSVNSCASLTSYTEQPTLLRLRKKHVSCSSSSDGFLADDEDNDDDEESSGFYSDASDAFSYASGRLRTFRHRAGLYYHSQLPLWLRNNEFILFGHRPPTYSYKACFKSLFNLHTETLNIWTHMLGSLGCALYAMYFYLAEVVPGLNWADNMVFGVFFSSAVFCMGMSAVYHTLSCHSSRVCNVTCKLDFTGITVLILGSFYPWLYYTFYCHPGLRFLYGLCGTVSAMAVIKMSLSDEFAKASYRGVRSAIFISYAMICGVLPVFHYSMMYGMKHMIEDCHFNKFILMVAFYVIGALFYSLRIPEKFYPGKFDYLLQSHQIMHICVILGNLAHYWGCQGLANLRHIEEKGLCLNPEETTVSSVFEPLLTAWVGPLLQWFA